MAIGEAGKAEVSEHIAIDDEERLVELFSQHAERADGPERLPLLGVLDAKVPLLPALAEALDDMAEVSGGDVDITDIVAAQPVQEQDALSGRDVDPLGLRHLVAVNGLDGHILAKPANGRPVLLSVGEKRKIEAALRILRKPAALGL